MRIVVPDTRSVNVWAGCTRKCTRCPPPDRSAWCAHGLPWLRTGDTRTATGRGTARPRPGSSASGTGTQARTPRCACRSCSRRAPATRTSPGTGPGEPPSCGGCVSCAPWARPQAPSVWAQKSPPPPPPPLLRRSNPSAPLTGSDLSFATPGRSSSTRRRGVRWTPVRRPTRGR